MSPRRAKAEPDPESGAFQAEAEVARRPGGSHYLVVARRYRPQSFQDLVGQEHVASALSNAIRHGRVGHAYLFTGARGVGKTSTARIFAKALNCVEGPTPEPCNRCEICLSISNGEDVDVLEIDGASNRGIEEIRQLRQSIAVRPSRSRYKIYIIDEVHMLTKEAFNALLKTLEEPPEHVKFIFCTTEPNKVPITILSRCQRFDFAGIRTPEIVDRLRAITETEKVAVDDGVLELVARKASGSMRDAQSLLEQLLSFASDRLTLEDANRLLGLAGNDAVEAVVAAVAAGDAGKAFGELHRALAAGADAAILMEQLLAFYRDCLAASLGCKGDVLLTVGPGQAERAAEIGRSLGLHRLMASMQILDYALARMRVVTHDRIVAELALVRLVTLDEMEDLHQILAELRSQSVGNPPVAGPGPPSAPQPRPGETLASAFSRAGSAMDTKPTAGTAPRESRPTRAYSGEAGRLPGQSDGADRPLGMHASRPQKAAETPDDAKPDPAAAEQVSAAPPDADRALEIWRRAVESLPVLLAEQARQFDRVNWLEDGRLQVLFRPQAQFSHGFCSRPENKARIEAAVRRVHGGTAAVDLVLTAGSSLLEARNEGPVSQQQQLFDIMQNPLVRKAIDVFGAEPTQVLPPAKQPRESSLFSEDEAFSSDVPEPD
ncbi:MAG: DNA polymerase III subunit gamma/tau, partial [Thermogutta sp.]|nr:DNA polymerase III subunit gamma/tau [Thermogutta sp.]